MTARTVDILLRKRSVRLHNELCVSASIHGVKIPMIETATDAEAAPAIDEEEVQRAMKAAIAARKDLKKVEYGGPK